MEEIFGHVLNVMLPVLLCVLAGFGLSLIRFPFDTKMVGGLVARIGYPTLVLTHLSGQHLSFSSFMMVMAAAVVMVAAFGLISFVFLKSAKLSIRAFLSPMMLNNVGNIGLPVASLAFGDQGLAVAIAFVVVVLIAIFTIGMAIPMGKFNPVLLAKQPIIYAVVIALILMVTKTPLPGPLDKGLGILAGLAIPLMLLTLGFSLATLKTGGLFRAFYLTGFHLVMAIVVAAGLSQLFHFEGATRNAVILLCFMPPSVATYLWVNQYQPEYGPDVAGFILISTLASLLVLPLVLTYWI